MKKIKNLKNMKSKTWAAGVLCAIVALPAVAQELDASKFPENTTIKGYAKRDRVLLGSSGYVSPSQLHEIKDFRVEASGEVSNTRVRSGNTVADVSTPVANLMASYGTDDFSLGLSGSYLSADNDSRYSADETFKSQKVLPQLAYTMASNVTVGLGYEFNNLKSGDAEGKNEFAFDVRRPQAGLSYHTPVYEFGVAYYGSFAETSESSKPRSSFLGFAAHDSLDSRSVYVPAEAVVYARTNATENVSLMGLASMSRYDGNVDGAVSLFEDYDSSDRLAGKLISTYWTEGRSRVSLTAEYKGGATTAMGSEEAGLGYRMANTFGGSLEGVLSFNRQTYLGLMAGYSEGSRNEVDNKGTRYESKEVGAKYAGTLAVKF